MRIGKVIDNVWATRKDESLVGVKLMVVQLFDRAKGKEGTVIVAADLIGAGIGEKVIVTEGSSARQMDNLANYPIDAVIIGIIDAEKKVPAGA